MQVDLGNILAIAVAAAAAVANWTRTNARSEANAKAIDELRKEREAAAEKIYSEIRREIGAVRDELRREVDTIHKRYDKHQQELIDGIKALGIEMRANHVETLKFRETVAKEYVTDDKLAGVMQQIHNDLSALGKRIDAAIERRGGGEPAS